MRLKTTFFILLFINLQIGLGQNNPCLESQSFKIVVLGSSTAAGAGVSVSDSAWVNKYRVYLKGINPDNELINLAVGGFNTYKIMPNGFVPPVNRPLSDSNKNITQALSLNPDAIIVNLPSNDNSSGYSVAEQLSNLDSLYALSNSNNIPIWICTTQPVNYNSAAQRQIQEDLKDSINLRYGQFAIDFWTTIALADNSIDSIYNTDGTHLNDAGHAILTNRVINTNILGYLYSTITFTDYWARDVHLGLGTLCGDTVTQFSVVVANIGAINTSQTTVYFNLKNLTTGSVFFDSLVLPNTIPSCSYDTIVFEGNTMISGNYSAQGIIKNINDTHALNDTAVVGFFTIGHPVILAEDDTLCNPSITTLHVNSAAMDTTFWYTNFTDTQAVYSGSDYQTPFLTSSQTWYVETVRGNLYYSNTLKTRDSSSINWNGAMFDIVANTDLVVDSFDVKITSLGSQIIEIYRKSGSYIGSELNSSAWSFIGFRDVFVTSVDEFTSVGLGNFTLSSGDTAGIYIQMANPSSTLGYQWASIPTTRSNAELTMVTGSGISHNNSNLYYPRDWAGKVYYHYGNRPNGECKTDRLPIHARVSQTQFNIGADTIIDMDASISFSGPTGMQSYLWFDGSTNPDVLISGSDLGYGIHYISLEVMDSLKCSVSDELVLGIADLVSVDEISKTGYKIYPNPVHNTIHIEAGNVEKIAIYSASGFEVCCVNNNFNRVDVSFLETGVYVIKITIDRIDYYSKFIKN